MASSSAQGRVRGAPRIPPNAIATAAVTARHPRPFEGLWMLRSGQLFSGLQYVGERNGLSTHVTLEHVDVFNSRLTAIMHVARNEQGPWCQAALQGEIIDNRNFTFKTDKWGARFIDDLDNWSAFRGFSPLTEAFAKGWCAHVELHEIDLSDMNCVFMRWKEMASIGSAQVAAGLQYTTMGFYYMCMDRGTGQTTGVYFDEMNRAWRKLELVPRLAEVEDANAEIR